ncbi:hypothetical protein PV04_10301 [Phialophora macrospora]|uniref:Uncharacterized protein n=1 Tax=Phialophora macrospora TaxID=1851006 RepID=A0A0D2F951_9EURO|nr:hypothetical protein PV04_10301 [Phialophora macrospora]
MATLKDKRFTDFFKKAQINTDTIKTARTATENLLTITSFVSKFTKNRRDFPNFPVLFKAQRKFVTYIRLLRRLRLDYEGLKAFERELEIDHIGSSLKDLGDLLKALKAPSTEGRRGIPNCSVIELLVELCFKSVSPTPTTLDEFERLVIDKLRSGLATTKTNAMTRSAIPAVVFVFTNHGNEAELMVTASTAEWEGFDELRGELKQSRINRVTCGDDGILLTMRDDLKKAWKGKDNGNELMKNGSLEDGWVETVVKTIESDQPFKPFDHSTVQGRAFRVCEYQQQDQTLFQPTPRCVKCRVFYEFNMGTEADPANPSTIYYPGNCAEDIAHRILQLQRKERKKYVFTTDKTKSVY